MDVLITVCIFLHGLILVSSNEALICPDGQFMPPGGLACVECSRCPENQIVRETCWQRRDTVCGTFTEFQPFQANEKVNILQTVDVDVERNVKTLSHKETSDNTRGVWQTASIVMIVLLAITSVLCVTLIATVCYRRRQDKKDGLMIYTGKGSTEVTASGSSCNRKMSSSSVTSRVSHQFENPREQCVGRVQQFELSEDKLST